MTERGKNLLLLLATMFLTLLFCEVALRLWHHVPLLELKNHRRGRGDIIDMAGTVRYDSLLGWSARDNVDKPGVHIVDSGVRRNSPLHTRTRPDDILVVGSSFTWGWEVADDESWPAQLEAIIGVPVDNAAVPGFALDQSVLRAEQLLSVMHPRLLLVSIQKANIDWNGFSLLRNPKPYFTVERGELSVHNIPVPTFRDADPFEPVIAVLAYSHVLDRVMARLDPGGWYSRAVPVANDPVDISCRLLRRLKLRADERGTAVGLVSEFWGEEVLASDRPPARLASVQECASAAGYRVISTFDGFKRVSMADLERFRDLYLKTNSGRFGHYSALGDRLVAEIVAAALRSEPLPRAP
jgi:hypothetical protein